MHNFEKIYGKWKFEGIYYDFIEITDDTTNSILAIIISPPPPEDKIKEILKAMLSTAFEHTGTSYLVVNDNPSNVTYIFEEELLEGDKEQVVGAGILFKSALT